MASGGYPEDYKTGFIGIYNSSKRKLQPVALNSGLLWKTKGLKRNSGKISVKFMPAIQSGLSRKDFESKLEETIERETNLLIKK